MPFRQILQFFIIYFFGFILSATKLYGAEFQTETALVYIEVDGESAAEIAIRLQESGATKKEISSATRKQIGKLSIKHELIIKELEKFQGKVEK